MRNPVIEIDPTPDKDPENQETPYFWIIFSFTEYGERYNSGFCGWSHSLQAAFETAVIAYERLSRSKV